MGRSCRKVSSLFISQELVLVVGTIRLRSTLNLGLFSDPLLNIAVEVSDIEITAFLSYVECTIGSTKLIPAINVLRVLSSHPKFDGSARYWYLVAVANRKLHLYQNARFVIHRSLKIEGTSAVTGREKILLDKLLASEVKQPVLQHFQKKKEKIVFCCDKSKSSDWYDIVSVDGGGTLGIIPSMFIAEIEKRAARPIATMTNLLAGTSTGAIIVGALTTRSAPESKQPKLFGQELVELYSDPARLKKIFEPSPYYFMNLMGSKYTATGRSKIIREYVGHTTLSQTLTEIVITAVKKKGPSNTKVFNREEDPTLQLHDAIMASRQLQPSSQSIRSVQKHILMVLYMPILLPSWPSLTRRN